MADILSQEEIDALLSATEGDELPEKAEPPEDVEERRREALRGLFVRTEKDSFQTRKYIRKYSDEEIEGLIEEEKREAQIERRKEELQKSYIEFDNKIHRKQYTDEEIEKIIEEEFYSA